LSGLPDLRVVSGIQQKFWKKYSLVPTLVLMGILKIQKNITWYFDILYLPDFLPYLNSPNLATVLVIDGLCRRQKNNLN
jgi:hypothetical protein